MDVKQEFSGIKIDEWNKIGADTPEKLIPYIINMDDCLMDSDDTLEKIDCRDFVLIEDLGTQLRQYNDADNKVHLIHSGVVTRKGARKQDLFLYIKGFSDRLVLNDRIVDFGEIDCGLPLTMKNDDVVDFISRLIEYAVYRNEYKKMLSKNSKR